MGYSESQSGPCVNEVQVLMLLRWDWTTSFSVLLEGFTDDAPNNVCSLNGERVIVPCAKQVRKFGRDKFPGLYISPQLVLEIRMHLLAGSLCGLPLYRHMLILPSLMNDLGDSARPNSWAVGDSVADWIHPCSHSHCAGKFQTFLTMMLRYLGADTKEVDFMQYLTVNLLDLSNWGILQGKSRLCPPLFTLAPYTKN